MRMAVVVAVLLLMIGAGSAPAAQQDYNLNFTTFNFGGTGQGSLPFTYGPLTISYPTTNYLLNNDGLLLQQDAANSIFFDLLNLDFSYATWNLKVFFGSPLAGFTIATTTQVSGTCTWSATPVCGPILNVGGTPTVDPLNITDPPFNFTTSSATPTSSSFQWGTVSEPLQSLQLDFTGATEDGFLITGISFSSDIPEPATLLLLGAGLLGLGSLGRFRRRKA